MKTTHPSVTRRGFVLLEAMLAVAIFSLGVLTLGRCVSNCLTAEQYKVEDLRARLALENRLAAIEGGAIPVGKPLTEDLQGAFAGLKLRQTPTAVKKQNEKREDLTGLLAVRVEVTWLSGGESHSKEIIFYAQAPTP